MRQIIYDRTGEPALYLTGAGVVYTLRNRPVGRVQSEQLVDYRGETLGWFEGAFLWDAQGKLLGFVKGAKPGDLSLTLPKTRPLRVKPAPGPAPFHPLFKPVKKPELQWVWSEWSLEELVSKEMT